MKRCPQCGFWNEDNAVKCEQCHAPLAKADPESTESSAPFPSGMPQATTDHVPFLQRFDWKRLGILFGAVIAILVVAAIGTMIFRFISRGTTYDDALQAMEKGDYAGAVSLLEKSVSYGNEDALYQLGELYVQGNGVTADPNKGNEMRQEALAAGSSLANYRFALEDLDVYVISGDNAALSSCMEKLEVSKEPEAYYRRSLLLRVSGDIEQADTLLKKASDAHCLEAMCDAAQQYLDQGENEEAKKLLNKYGNSQDPTVQAALAWVAMHNGDSTSWQTMQALADSGCALANAYLGDIYYDGMVTGLKRDFNTAFNYYDLAAQEGCVRGMLGKLMAGMVRGDTNYDEIFTQATQLYRMGYVDAGAVMGNMMYDGMGRDVDLSGLQYIIAAANNGYAPAELFLASYYYNQNDLDKCQQYLTNAYNHGSRADANRNAIAYLGEDSVIGPDTFY